MPSGAGGAAACTARLGGPAESPAEHPALSTQPWRTEVWHSSGADSRGAGQAGSPALGSSISSDSAAPGGSPAGLGGSGPPRSPARPPLPSSQLGEGDGNLGGDQCPAGGPQGCDCTQFIIYMGVPRGAPAMERIPRRLLMPGDAPGLRELRLSKRFALAWGTVGVTVALGHCRRPDPGAQGPFRAGLGVTAEPAPALRPHPALPLLPSTHQYQPHPAATTPGCRPSPGASSATTSPAQVATVRSLLGCPRPPGSGCQHSRAEEAPGHGGSWRGLDGLCPVPPCWSRWDVVVKASRRSWVALRSRGNRSVH